MVLAPLLALGLGPTPALAQVSLTMSFPGVSIGLNVPVYPVLVQVPGYPVYYDPHSSSNYFFYDGLYWVYQQDAWYSSAWYDGPWQQVGPESVPLFVLRVPVRYYRRPPSYFRGWQGDAPPRWGEHWGRGWEDRRSGWERWDRHAVPAPAPLPSYQRQYAGDRYPRAPEQQHRLRTQNYRHEPKEAVSRQLTQPPRPAPQERGREAQPEPKAKGREAQPAPKPQQRGREAQPEQKPRGREGQGDQREKDR
jgi:hypothetical protein